MSDRIKVSTSILADAAVQLREAVNEMRDVQKRLMQIDTSEASGGLLEADWHHEISDNIHVSGENVADIVRALEKAAGKLGDRVSEIERAVRESARIFEQAEKENRSYFSEEGTNKQSVYTTISGGAGKRAAALMGSAVLLKQGGEAALATADAAEEEWEEIEEIPVTDYTIKDGVMAYYIANHIKQYRTEWATATKERKYEIIRNIVEFINRIQGTKVVFRNDRKIEKSYAKKENREVNGLYHYKEDTFTLNPSTLDENFSSVMDTVIHEMRHAYQRAAVNDPEAFGVPREIADEWRDNFANPVPVPKAGDPDAAEKTARNGLQAIELDAYTWGYDVGRMLDTTEPATNTDQRIQSLQRHRDAFEANLNRQLGGAREGRG